MSKPIISVCLLTYNRAEVLPRSIESILTQGFRNFELLINDDCSSDDTREVCEYYAKKDQRIKYFRNEKNLRYAGNQNAALKRAHGDFIAYVHDGDVYYPFMLESWLATLSQYPSAGIVFNAVDVRAEHGVQAATHVHDYEPFISGDKLFDEMIVSSSSPIFGIVMLRTAMLRSVGEFDTNLPVLADVDMWLRLLLKFDAAYVRTPLYEVMPREVGHINRQPVVNWSIQAERDTIFALNLARRYGHWDNVPADLRRGLMWSRFMENGRALAKAGLKGDILKFYQGIKALATGRPIGITLDLREQLNGISSNM